MHHAVDDHSRLVHTEILADEKKETTTALWLNAAAFFAAHGITVRVVLTDNGACYRSWAFTTALGPSIKHRKTRPYRPQTNGKVERFNRTLTTELAYARPYTSEAERAATYSHWLHQYIPGPIPASEEKLPSAAFTTSVQLVLGRHSATLIFAANRGGEFARLP